MSIGRISAAFGVALVVTLGSACGRNEEAGGLRDVSRDQLRREGMLTLGDSQVVNAMKAPQVPGRIVYEPPTDLSLTNAQRTRPDLFGGDTARRTDTGRGGARRDTTAGDATADTSGGAARPRRP